jgi:hypothetical protein
MRIDEHKDFLEHLYDEFLEFSRLRPYRKSPFYDYFHKIISDLSY